MLACAETIEELTAAVLEELGLHLDDVACPKLPGTLGPCAPPAAEE